MTTSHQLSRRGFLVGAATISAGAALAACTRGLQEAGPSGGDDVIRIGYVSPRTGAYSAFGEADAYILAAVREAWADGLKAGGRTYRVEILDRDTGSDPEQAATIATELISERQVDLVLVTSTPETVNPVASQCEAEGVPCLSTIVPWQAFYFGQGATPDNPFRYTYHFFNGLEEIAGAETDMWDLVSTNKRVGVLWPNDVDGGAFRDEVNGFRSDPVSRGYVFVDPGAYENGTKDFSSIIATFKREGVEILAGVPTPPDFATFWAQAAQQRFVPKIATISKAVLFPSAVAAIPNGLGENVSSASWWHRDYPYTSPITGLTAAELCDDYEASELAGGPDWNTGLGPNLALFEVAAGVLSATDPKDKEAVADQFSRTRLDTIMGPLDWTSGGPKNPVPNVATVPMVGTQWTRAEDGSFVPRIVSNRQTPNVPVDGTIVPLA